MIIRGKIGKGNYEETIDLMNLKISTLTLIFGKKNEAVISNLRSLGDLQFRADKFKDAIKTL